MRSGSRYSTTITKAMLERINNVERKVYHIKLYTIVIVCRYSKNCKILAILMSERKWFFAQQNSKSWIYADWNQCIHCWNLLMILTRSKQYCCYFPYIKISYSWILQTKYCTQHLDSTLIISIFFYSSLLTIPRPV